MKRRLIIPVVLSACLICASCKAADRAEVPDLSGNITLSGRLTCEDISAEVNLERNNKVWTVSLLSLMHISGPTGSD